MRAGIAAVLTTAVTLAGHAPQSVPIVELPPAKVRTAQTFGGVLGLRETSGGRVLVNDARRKQLWLYDTTLAKPTLVTDSTDYGIIGVPLIAYIGDSSLMADLSGPSSLLVLDGSGKVARSLALPTPEAGSFANAMSFVDSKGRLVYAVTGRIRMPREGTVGPQDTYLDSNPVMRIDLDARRTDSVGRVAKNKGEYAKIDRTTAKKIVRTIIENPLPQIDEWAVLTDGSIAFVRGHDYHIDWLRPDGTASSTPKLPFDWKPVTDAEKDKLIDSTRAAHAAQNKFADSTRNLPPPPPPMQDDAGRGSRQRTADGAGITRAAYDAGGNLWVPLSYDVVDKKDIPDYWPPIRQGAVLADLDNHLWILPATSARSRNGELVYDVVNTQGELFQRVRVPVGRQVAGFGKNGVVYLLSGDKAKGFYLERTRLLSSTR